MKTRIVSFVRGCVIFALLLTLALSGQPPTTAQARTDAAASAALIFIENAGQFADGARFQVRGAPQGTVWLAEDAIWLTIVEPVAVEDARSPLGPERGQPDPLDQPRRAATIKLSFVGANPQPRLEPFNRLETHVSFLTGSDPAQWRADVPVWGGVRYVDLYPGIDLELTGEQGQLLPRLTARPNAGLNLVRLRVEGADAAVLDGDALRLSTAAGEVIVPLLQAEGSNVEVAVQPHGTMVFEVVAPFAPEDAKPTSGSPLADDPADLLYGTFLGGSEADCAQAIAVDGSGAAYVTGLAWSGDFPTTAGAFNESPGGVFVAKLNAAGSALEYATFLGWGMGEAIAVDASGKTYVTGQTASAAFPVTPGAFDTTFNGGGPFGGSDAFVAKLNADGSDLDYSTFLGGNGDDLGHGIAVDGSGAAYITGETGSSDFPTTVGAFDTSYNGGLDGFVAKLNADGSDLDYGTFLGGSEQDVSTGIAVDGSGAAYVTGGARSSAFPITPGAFGTTINGGDDTFVVKLNADGSDLDYGTFLGGSGGEWGRGIAVNGSGVATITGETGSSDFPTTAGAFDTSYNGGDSDAFAAKLNADGSALDYATFLGGDGNDLGDGIAIDPAGAAYMTGYTQSPDFPTTPGAFDTSYSGDQDAFAAKLNTDGSALEYSTFLGGNAPEWGYDIAVGESGVAYVTGGTTSSDLPTTPCAFDRTYNGGNTSPSAWGDAFVAKLAMGGTVTYSICGRVTGIGGEGLLGVTVSAAAGGSAMTDTSGSYTISSVITGTYTLIPTLESYRFLPATRTVDVPPTTAGLDFALVASTVCLPLVLRNP